MHLQPLFFLSEISEILQDNHTVTNKVSNNVTRIEKKQQQKTCHSMIITNENVTGI